MVDVRLDEDLVVSYRSGADSALEIVVWYEGNRVVGYQTNSKPWDEGIVQVRNVVAMNLEGEYERDELLALLMEAVSAHESDLRALYE